MPVNLPSDRELSIFHFHVLDLPHLISCHLILVMELRMLTTLSASNDFSEVGSRGWRFERVAWFMRRR